MYTVWNPLLNAYVAAAFDAEWREEDHPRQDDGKFGAAGGGKPKTFRNATYAEEWPDDVHEKAEQVAGNYEALSDSEINAVDNYAAVYYDAVNNGLRGGSQNELEDKEFQNLVQNLDAAISASKPLQEPMQVYRGVDKKLFAKFAKAKVINDKGFTSTSLDRSIAKFFGGGVDNNAHIVIRLPKGTKGVFVPAVATADEEGGATLNEAEFLLPRNAKFKVLSAGARMITVEYILP